jgi:hypothetical protein
MFPSRSEIHGYADRFCAGKHPTGLWQDAYRFNAGCRRRFPISAGSRRLPFADAKVTLDFSPQNNDMSRSVALRPPRERASDFPNRDAKKDKRKRRIRLPFCG